MKRRFVSLALVAILFTPVSVSADASGPDYFRVVGVASNDVLNIRAQPTARSAKIGAIPPYGDGIQNLGCQGGLTYAQWESASPAQREAAKKRVWCRINYRGVYGWVAGWFLAEGSAR